MKTEEVKLVYDTLLCSPGMDEQVRLDFKISRKEVLLLAQLFERGQAPTQGAAYGIAEAIDKESLASLKTLMAQSLEKANLKVLSEKLKNLQISS